MRTPLCVPIPCAARYVRKAVRALQYDGERLVVDIQGRDFAFARVIFSAPIGFRVLDERDLTEFWPTYSEPQGWLFEVTDGGWLDLEKQRSSFSSADLCAGLREFLIVDQRCISVLGLDAPAILDVGRAPQGGI